MAETVSRPHYQRDDRTFPSYHVRFTKHLSESDDPGNSYIEGRYLARALTRAWVYATGLPLGDRGYDLFYSKTLLPAQWQSNAPDVIPAGDWQLLTSDISYEGLYRQTPEWPLRAAIDIMGDLANASDVVQSMADYHCTALETRDSTLHLLLFAQGMTIARELLPGDTDNRKEQLLPAYITGRKRRSLHWLFGTSNIRRETRHVITKLPSVSLHPAMEDDEVTDYQHDADLLLRYAVSTQLARPLVDHDDGLSTVVT